MPGTERSSDAEEPAAPREWLEAALDWWREAGVDQLFVDSPQVWLAPPAPEIEPASAPERRAPEPKRAAPIEAPPALFGGDPAHWPATLAEFPQWWLTEPSLAEGPAARRVPPAGPANAPLMVLVAMPEAGDDAQLLSGREGRLLDAILAAIGLSRAEIYLASALPAREAMPDWSALGAAGLGRVIAHHIALAAPQKLLVLGRSDISSLIAHDPANKTAILHSANQDGVSVPLAFGYGLEAMLAQPVLKRGLWASLVEWSDAARVGAGAS